VKKIKILEKQKIWYPFSKNCVWEPAGMNCLRTGTLKHGWIFLVNFKKPSPGLLNNFFLKKRELGQVWEKGPETRTRWVLKSETRPTLVQTPTGNKCDNVKTGTRRFSSKRGPGQNWWVPRLPSDRPSVPLVVSVRRVPRPNRTLGTCALRALRCSPSLRVAVAGSNRL
jgi:hypothetical protein